MVSEKQHYIVENLSDFFYEKRFHKQGRLMPDSKMTYENIPDMAYYTREQTKAAAQGQHTIASFVIEIISDSDYAKDIETKLWEYFKNGVQVVWHIMPYQKLVKVYTSPRDVSICLEADICSAKPALTDFEITVNQIFQLKD